MKSVSMHEAKTHLSRLVKEEFVITNNGVPVARVVPLGERAGGRFGFLPDALAKEARIPDDFDAMGVDAIAEIFGISE
jgi:prevent-host-death family protein